MSLGEGFGVRFRGVVGRGGFPVENKRKRDGGGEGGGVGVGTGKGTGKSMRKLCRNCLRLHDPSRIKPQKST